MPHLSPLSWALAPILFWSVIASSMAFLWWSNSLSFPSSLTSASQLPTQKWPWL